MQIIPNDAKPDPLQKKSQGPPVAPEVFAKLLNQQVHQKVGHVAGQKQAGIMQSKEKPSKEKDLLEEDENDEASVQNKLDKAKKRLIRFVQKLSDKPKK